MESIAVCNFAVFSISAITEKPEFMLYIENLRLLEKGLILVAYSMYALFKHISCSDAILSSYNKLI